MERVASLKIINNKTERFSIKFSKDFEEQRDDQ